MSHTEIQNLLEGLVGRDRRELTAQELQAWEISEKYRRGIILMSERDELINQLFAKKESNGV